MTKLDVTEMHRQGLGSVADRAVEEAMSAGFRPSSERVKTEESERIDATKGRLSFGIGFLDHALGGIDQSDVILIGADSGVGKTELSQFIATFNAVRGKTVHFFALEAEKAEMERRTKYRMVADMLFNLHRDPKARARMNYMDWHDGKLRDLTGRYDDAVTTLMVDRLSTMHTLYRVRDFDVKQMQQRFLEAAKTTDLIVLDHLHYVDSNDANENRGHKIIVKCIRDIALDIGKPVIVVAHLRKSDERYPKLVPNLDAFMGSSDIAKISTKAILLSQARDQPSGQRHVWNTYINPAKCRKDGSRTRFVAVVPFNAATNSYEDTYTLGRMEKHRTEFVELKADEIPQWATGATLTAKPDDREPPKDWRDT